MKQKGSRWSETEILYLLNNAGKKSLEQIARKLGRSYAYTVVKAGELGVANGKLISPLYTANQLAKVLGVASSTVINWTEDQGLPFKWVKLRKSFSYKMIDMSDFYQWAESRQDQIDTRKFKVTNLGKEPSWLIAKRKQDSVKPRAYARPWTIEDEQRLVALVSAGTSKKEIACLLQRSEFGIQRKVDRLKIRGDLPIDKRGEFYTESEERLLLKCKARGMTGKEIAIKLRRSEDSVHQKYRMMVLSGRVP